MVPCGHSRDGKGYETYQTMGALLALNGMAALVFDPIDQVARGLRRVSRCQSLPFQLELPDQLRGNLWAEPRREDNVFQQVATQF